MSSTTNHVKQYIIKLPSVIYCSANRSTKKLNEQSLTHNATNVKRVICPQEHTPRERERENKAKMKDGLENVDQPRKYFLLLFLNKNRIPLDLTKCMFDYYKYYTRYEARPIPVLFILRRFVHTRNLAMFTVINGKHYSKELLKKCIS